MHTVLLLLFSLSGVDPLIERGMKLASEKKAKLMVFFSVEKTIPEALSSVMNYIGFLGEKAQEDVKHAIINNYKSIITSIKSDVEKQALLCGVESSSYILERFTFEDLLELANDTNAKFILINYHQNVGEFMKNRLALKSVQLEQFIDGKKLY